MNRIYFLPVIFVFSIFSGFVNGQISSDEIITPEAFFGFKPGADRMLFGYQKLIDYFKLLDEQSPRIKMIEIGETPMGKKMYMAFLSSEENINKLDRLKEINRELALNQSLTEEQSKGYVKEGKVFILATLSMHASEVGPSQSSPLIAYEAATTTDPEKLEWMSDVVYMIVPSQNPDGMDIVVNHYNKTKGTKYEGGNLPEVYHKYVGHDNNRDYVTLTQSDNLAIARIYNKTWFPQVMVEKHQMGSTGPRYFVPPMHDPISENVNEKIWNWTWVFGSNMATDMAADGLTGISQHYNFDDYWPGSTETAIWKNVVGLLTEMASVQYAKPVYIEKSELKVSGKGLGEYKKSINMPKPWEGGWWRLSDMVKYEISSSWSLIKTGSKYRSDLLTNRNELCREEISKGKTLKPAYFIIPKHQTDSGELIDLITLLDEHGVSVYALMDRIRYENLVFEKGDYVVPLAQPFRAFIKEVLEKQDFPARHYTPGGELIPPYDITSWSLPMHRGLKSFQVDSVAESIEAFMEKVDFPVKVQAAHGENIKTLLFPVTNNESFKIAFAALKGGFKVSRVSGGFKVGENQLNTGDFIIGATGKNMDKLHELLEQIKVPPVMLPEEVSGPIIELKLPRIALVETNFADMDAGWTRYIFDQYKIPFTIIKPGDVEKKDLSETDVIVFPDNNSSILLDGKYKSSDNTYSIPALDPQYAKGIGKEGVQKLMKFAEDGGIIVSWGQSTGLFMGAQSIKISDKEKEEFELPVSDISKSLEKLYIPGSLLNIELNQGNPLTLGMDKTAYVFTRGRPVFSTSIPYFDTDRRVIAGYPEKEILASGYAGNEELLAGKPVMVWIRKGKGQFVMYGFSPQFRASTTGTYKLLFNALFLKQPAGNF